MKKNRHDAILSIIETQDISTQEELMKILLDMGFKATQATVSRDIKALKLVKTPVASGQYKYAVVGSETEDNSEKYTSILRHSIIKVDYAVNMTVIKCYSGMAQATCTAVDAMYDGEIVGTIAGDDTVFILCRTEDAAVGLMNAIQKIIK